MRESQAESGVFFSCPPLAQKYCFGGRLLSSSPGVFDQRWFCYFQREPLMFGIDESTERGKKGPLAFGALPPFFRLLREPRPHCSNSSLNKRLALPFLSERSPFGDSQQEWRIPLHFRAGEEGCFIMTAHVGDSLPLLRRHEKCDGGMKRSKRRRTSKEGSRRDFSFHE